MPGLRTTLSDYDLDFLNRIARIWRIEISQRDVNSAVTDLIAGMVAPGSLEEVLSWLPENSRIAWKDLVSNGGHMPLAVFSRKNGDIRAIGPARRERENPDQNPASVSENLWYSGMVGKAFLMFSAEAEEYIYIPEEFLPPLPAKEPDNKQLVRPSIEQKPRKIIRGDSSILDHLTDMLAAARMHRMIPLSIFQEWEIPREFLSSLLLASGLLEKSGQPNTEKLKTFFQESRSQNLHSLFQIWLASSEINDLRMLPGMLFEGSWVNNPLLPRKLLIGILSELKLDTWWSIPSVLAMVKEQTPDFQRPAGDYDSWFIRNVDGDSYLRGFEHWDEVEGTLIYYFLTGPLKWLGILNLAGSKEKGITNTFQLTPFGKAVIDGKQIPDGGKEDQEIIIKGIDSIIIPRYCPRIQRYQVARFCELVAATSTSSNYVITPSSLAKASEQGLTINHLTQMLEKDRIKAIPGTFKKAAERWQKRGLEVEVKTAILLRFGEESTCSQIQNDPNSARYKFEVLNSKTLLISRDHVEGVRKYLAEMGILAQIDPDV